MMFFSNFKITNFLGNSIHAVWVMYIWLQTQYLTFA